MSLKLKQLESTFKVVKLAPDSQVRLEQFPHPYFVTHSEHELSIIVEQSWEIPKTHYDCEPDWIGFVVDQPLQFDMVGIIAGIARILAEADVSLMAISSFDTDYFFVKKAKLQCAITALRKSHYEI